MVNRAANHMKEQVSSRVVASIQKDRAWELLRDLSLAHNYVPGIIDTRITTAQNEGIGASREVYQGRTKSLNETVEDWNEGYGFLIRLHCGEEGPPFPFKEAWFRYAIEDNGDGSTVLIVSLIYVMRWGILGRLLNRILLKRFIGNRIRDVALSMKLFYETGKPVTPEMLKQATSDIR
ncbi:MAG: SRPBCC family protein [Dehalococcoidia bacterium]